MICIAKFLNCWNILLKGQSAAKPCYKEGSTTIPQGSTLQASGSGKGNNLFKRLRYSLIYMVTYSSLKTAKRVASFCEDNATLENIAANENSRGKRFQSGLMEECVGIDQDILNEVIIPQYILSVSGA